MYDTRDTERALAEPSPSPGGRAARGEALRLAGKIDQHALTYDQWFRLGAALKGCGCGWREWDALSSADGARHVPGECERKWDGITGTGLGALHTLLVELGVQDRGAEISWDEELPTADVHDTATVTAEGPDPVEHAEESKEETIEMLAALFGPQDRVSYVVRFKSDGNGRWHPADRGHSDRTRDELVRDLEASSDIGGALGDYTPEGGALVRINPMDGKGAKDENVASYRHALVEFDHGTIEQQIAAIKRLGLPVTVMVYSGNKSIHAAVRVDATSKEQYRERVRFLYDHCKKNGLEVDEACRNPSRMTRLAGAVRNGVRQSLVATHVGLPSWDAWYARATGGEMPDIVNLRRLWRHLPPLAPEMIEGVLRSGHKMIIAGPSKAGKSFELIELAVSVAEGVNWLGRRCRQGRVLYVNLEVDSASCFHRFKDVYAAMNVPPDNVGNLDILNLRGHGMPLDKLAPLILEKCEGKEYAMMIIDPIYKVITGDENSATDMAYFTAQLDLLADRLGCSVVYAHHHSKGKQGWKYSIDRMSGSGVFARDPDAILDMSPISATTEQRLAAYAPEYKRLVAEAAAASGISPTPKAYAPEEIAEWARRELPDSAAEALITRVDEMRKDGESLSAYRISFSLREFRSPPPTDVWFSHPIHIVDTDGVLAECKVNGEPGRPTSAKGGKRNEGGFDDIGMAFALLAMGGPNVMISDLADFLGVSVKTTQRRLDRDGHFERANGMAWLKVA